MNRYANALAVHLTSASCFNGCSSPLHPHFRKFPSSDCWECQHSNKTADVGQAMGSLPGTRSTTPDLALSDCGVRSLWCMSARRPPSRPWCGRAVRLLRPGGVLLVTDNDPQCAPTPLPGSPTHCICPGLLMRFRLFDGGRPPARPKSSGVATPRWLLQAVQLHRCGVQESEGAGGNPLNGRTDRLHIFSEACAFS